MLLNSNVKPVQQCRSSIVKMSLRLFTALVFIVFCSVSPVFGTSTYSDMWLNDSNARIDGCGVTEGRFTHGYIIETVESSPQGRQVYGGGRPFATSESIGSARVDVWLAWDWNDIGDYTTRSEHWERCPFDEISYTLIGVTLATLRAGTSLSVYRTTAPHSEQDCDYDIIPNCNVACRTSSLRRPCTSEYIRRLQAWVSVLGFTICSPFLTNEIRSTTSTNCNDS